MVSEAMEPGGFEPRAGEGNAEKTGDSDECAAPRAAQSAANPPFDADLQQLIDAWPDLPEAVKAGILAMVKAAAGGGGDEG